MDQSRSRPYRSRAPPAAVFRVRRGWAVLRAFAVRWFSLCRKGSVMADSAVVTTLSPSEPVIAPRLLTLKQGAAYIGCSYWTLRDLVQNGTVPPVRVPSGRISTGRNRGTKQQGRVLVPSTDARVRSLRKVLVDRLDLDRLIAQWKEPA